MSITKSTVKRFRRRNKTWPEEPGKKGVTHIEEIERVTFWILGIPIYSREWAVQVNL